ncbi:hypothetical protein MNBD_BACTEROID06-82 [hydrothermal vent metagenome]|uniref:Lipoprotein n=1 Tax=hydrothermal vent metagenome TaxID=652676 RepID=A0A3B0UG57_9ZZZZ
MKKLSFLLLVLVGSCQIIINEEPSYYDTRDDLVGRYQIDEYSETTEEYFSYNIEILKSYNSNEVILYNFYDVGIDVIAQFNGYKLIIPRQFIGDYEVEGTGRLNDGELSISYIVRNNYQTPSTDFLYFTAWRTGY